MAKKDLKAYVRYDGSGRVIPGSLILNRFKPKVGNWKETNASLCCNSIVPSTVCMRLNLSYIGLRGNTIDDIKITWLDGDGNVKASTIPVQFSLPLSEGGFGSNLYFCGLPGSLSVNLGNNTNFAYTISEDTPPCDSPEAGCAYCSCIKLTWNPAQVPTIGYFRCDGVFVEVNPQLGTVSDCMQSFTPYLTNFSSGSISQITQLGNCVNNPVCDFD